jgi:hypothetical protein
MPEPRAQAILHDLEHDTEHASNKITATRLLDCPRAWAIPDNLPVVVDVRHFDPLHFGTTDHADMERFANGESELRVRGSVFGIPEISAKLDHVRSRLGCVRITDYKTHSEAAYLNAYASAPYPETVAQLNLQRELLKQDDGRVADELYTHHGTRLSQGFKRMRCASCKNTFVLKKGDTEIAPWHLKRIRVLSMREVGEIRLGGGAFTVQQVADIIVEYLQRIEGDEARAHIRALPLVGRTYRWPKCDRYCAWKRECDELGEE